MGSTVVDMWACLRIGRATVSYAMAILLLLMLFQLPMSGQSPRNDLPLTSPDQKETMDTDPPAAPLLTSAVLEGPSDENVLITWAISSDDGAGDNDVSHYAIYCSDGYDYDGEGYSYLDEVSGGTTSYVHSLAGDGDPFNHFYYVAANDTSGNTNWSGQAAKFLIPFKEGKQIASIPLVQEDTTLETVLQTLDGSFRHVRYYKSSDQSHHWKSYWTFKTYRTLYDIDHKMAFWIDIVNADDLVVVGLVPEVTQIELGHGWNFVGYPSFIERTLSDALAGIDWEKAQGYDDNPPFNLRQLSGGDVMTPGGGYWVWVDLPQVWEVSNAPSQPPYIVWTDPADGATGVPLNASIFVKFSKEMNTSSVIIVTSPDPGGFGLVWSEGNTLLEVLHNPWPENITLTFEVDGKDLDGNWLVPGPVPNPWSFTTTFDYPQIINIEPPPGGLIDPHQCFTIYFSEPMDVSSVTVNIMPFVSVVLTWNADHTELTICPVPQWEECTVYTVYIDGNDKAGNPLLGVGPVPLPFQFTTTCDDPYISETDPANNETNVSVYHPISIRFSEPMDTSSLSWTIAPDPGGWDPGTWLENDTLVVLNHLNPFNQCTRYMVEVWDAADKSGNPLVPGPVPNPWTFVTTAGCPYVLLSDPMNNQTNVTLWQPIIIVFSWSMNASSLVWKITPDPGGWNETWPSDTQLYLGHANPFQVNTTYIFEILYVEDIWGMPLCTLPFTLVFTTSP
ncbi:MAG: Ig-like domain-containing protein [Thermoplasmata archaeon]